MSTRETLRRSCAVAALLVAIAAAPAHATCSYVPLSSGTPLTATTSPTLFQFTQGVPYWSGVAVLPATGEDWDLYLYTTTAPDPTCATNVVISSTGGAGALDFVVGDFNHDALGTYYPGALRYSGTQPATVQWDGGADELVVNGACLDTTLDQSQLIRVYDVQLTAGVTYTFDFYPRDGIGGELSLFRNGTGGTYWGSRATAEFETDFPHTYTAPASGYYGVVVTSLAGAAFRYTLGVTTSTCPIPTLAQTTTPVTVAAPGGYYAFNAGIGYWAGFAVRPSSGDWDLQLYDKPTGGPSPTCLSGLLATSSLGGTLVDLTMADFGHSPFGWYFAYPYAFSGSASAQAQWTDYGNVLQVNDDPGSTAITSATLAQVHNVALTAGRTYTITFTPGVPGLTLLVFANLGGGAYFAGRGSAVLSATGTTMYTAPVTGEYAFVVANDGAVTSSYGLAAADCSLVTPLASGAAVGTDDVSNAYFAFTQTSRYWTAIACLDFGTDWDLYLSSASANAAPPACMSPILASSTGANPAQDVIVGDFNDDSPGTYYLRAHQFTAGEPFGSTIEWDSGADLIWPNDNNPVTHGTGSTDIVRCWDVYLTAGQAYEFDLSHTGSASLTLLLFRNTAGGTYWSGRSGAALTTTGSATYTAPTSGYYGVVVLNETGFGDTYYVQVKTCNPIVAIPAYPSVDQVSGGGATVGSFTQPNAYWTAVAVRPALATDDWDITACQSATGGAIGVCASGDLAYSDWAHDATDVVVGDFNYVTPGTYYAYADRYAGSGAGYLQAYTGNQMLSLNAPHQVRTVASTFLVECWDALLTAGQTYNVFFTHDPGLHVSVDVFKSTGGAFWGGRSSALLEASRTTSFVAPTSGYYGFVVVNDGGSGTYNIGLNSGAVAVDGPARPERDALRGVSPNPGRGGMRVDFALRDDAAACFEFVDMAGRVVSRLEPGERGPGTWSVGWAAGSADGRALPPGLYFVRMRIGDRTIGTRKLTLLE